MMGRILGKHPSIYTFGELHFFGQLSAPPFLSELPEEEIEKLAAQLYCIQREGYRTHGNPHRFLEEAQVFLAGLTLYPETSAALFEAFLHHEASENDRVIPCDQTPRNVFYIQDILELYSEAKIINMIRDPRDVLLSQKRKWKRRFLGGSDLPIKEMLRDWMKLSSDNHQPYLAQLLSMPPSGLGIMTEWPLSTLRNSSRTLKRSSSISVIL